MGRRLPPTEAFPCLSPLSPGTWLFGCLAPRTARLGTSQRLFGCERRQPGGKGHNELTEKRDFRQKCAVTQPFRGKTERIEGLKQLTMNLNADAAWQIPSCPGQSEHQQKPEPERQRGYFGLPEKHT